MTTSFVFLLFTLFSNLASATFNQLAFSGGGAFGGGGGVGGSGGGLGYKNNISVTPGNSYTVVVGTGGKNSYNSCSCQRLRGGYGAGGSGAVRIVWPGSSRQFPSTNVNYV